MSTPIWITLVNLPHANSYMDNTLVNLPHANSYMDSTLVNLPHANSYMDNTLVNLPHANSYMDSTLVNLPHANSYMDSTLVNLPHANSYMDNTLVNLPHANSYMDNTLVNLPHANSYMDNTLVNLPHANSYIVDIFVHSSSWGEHLIHIQEVLEQLRKVGLTAKPNKCVWGARALTYLGHEVGGGVVRVPELRVKAIKDFRLPRTKRDLRAFLGTVGYYRRFVPELGGRVQPLYHALRKEAPEVIDWDVGKLHSIEYLKTILCSNNILWLPRGDEFFILHTDASIQGIGAVLSTVRDREERPLGYFSRKLMTAESNYTVSELECLAVVRAVDAFAIHLHGREFRIINDQRALTALNTSSKLNGRLLRWALALQAYFFDVQHRAGVNHNNADGLSRQAWQEVDSIPDKDSKAEIKRDRLPPREGGMSGSNLLTINSYWYM